MAILTTSTSPGIQITPAPPEGISFLSWDTFGRGREQRNLLRSGELLQLWNVPKEGPPTLVPFVSGVSSEDFCWGAVPQGDKLRFWIRQPTNTTSQLVFPFEPAVTPVTVFPSQITPAQTFGFPLVCSAPDWGQLLLTVASNAQPEALLVGDRSKTITNLTVQIATGEAEEIVLEFSAVKVQLPEAPQDDPLSSMVLPGWPNVFQLTSAWGQSGSLFSAPSGILGNNVISDPCSFALWTYADAAFWTADAAPGISFLGFVRHTLEWWLDQRTTADGQCPGYWGVLGFQDANPSLLISAWDYVEGTGDLAWLKTRLGDLERLASFMASRDIDGDGLLEALQTGNADSLQQPNRSCCWWDAINCGYKDGYSNAISYRAWCCLADLELKLGRTAEAQTYRSFADHLKASYVDTLWNPATGWLGWWRSADGVLHDYASPALNGMAIEYGLLDTTRGVDVLAALRDKAVQVGFSRTDLGIPSFLSPVFRSDYLQPQSFGCPTQPDGTDTFQQYMNGGINSSHSLHWLVAHYEVGESEYADAFLRSMLEHQSTTGFQNGVVDVFPKGLDWTDWSGSPVGYEGYLADNYRFLQAAILRRPECRARLYRPMRAESVPAARTRRDEVISTSQPL